MPDRPHVRVNFNFTTLNSLYFLLEPSHTEIQYFQDTQTYLLLQEMNSRNQERLLRRNEKIYNFLKTTSKLTHLSTE